MYENGNTDMEFFGQNSENDFVENDDSSSEDSSVSSGENNVSDNSDSSEDISSSGDDIQEDLDQGTETEGDTLESEYDVIDDGSNFDEGTSESVEMVAIVEQLEAQNVLLESQVMFLSIIVFILMFNVCDRFISRIWSSIRSMGGSK